MYSPYRRGLMSKKVRTELDMKPSQYFSVYTIYDPNGSFYSIHEATLPP